MQKMPMIFKAQSVAGPGMKKTWKTSVGFGELTAALPPEFSGGGGGYSPEDFLLFAVLNCFTSTFKVVAELSKYEFKELKVQGTLTIDANERGRPEIKSIHVKATLDGASDKDQAEKLLEKSSKACLVANSLKIDKIYEFEII